MAILIPSRITYQAEFVEVSKAVAETSPEAPQAPSERVWSKDDISQLISKYAQKYGVSESVMHHIVKHESSYYPKAVGDKTYVCKRTGKVAPSYGLAQINVCWHDVSIEQAFDPEYAVEFLAKGLSTGKCSWWATCPL